MKLRCLYIFLLVAVYSAGCTAQPRGVTAIAFYNTENLFDTEDDPDTDDDEFTPQGPYHYTDNIYRQKLHNIATVLQQLGTDKDVQGAVLIGLAEIENGKVLTDLVAQPELSKRGYRYAWFNSADPRGIDVALLYDPHRFRMLKAEAVPATVNGYTEATRDVLHVKGILAGDTIHVLVNHWPSRREGQGATEPKRIAIAQLNKRILDGIYSKEPKAKVIIMGDLNDNPDDASVAKTLRAASSKPTNTQALYNPMADIYAGGKGSVLYKHHWDLFDQTIISGGFFTGRRLQYYMAEVYDRDFLFTQHGKFAGQLHRSFGGTRWLNGYSDHLPVILYLKQ